MRGMHDVFCHLKTACMEKGKSFVLLLSRLIANRIATLPQFEEEKNRNGKINNFVSWMASLITVSV